MPINTTSAPHLEQNHYRAISGNSFFTFSAMNDNEAKKYARNRFNSECANFGQIEVWRIYETDDDYDEAFVF